MIALPEKLIQAFNAHMVKSGVSAHLQSHYRKWLWFYADFCHKYRHPYSDALDPVKCERVVRVMEEVLARIAG
jgi:hypothetical protein